MTKAGAPYCIKQLIFTADCGIIKTNYVES